MKQNEETWHAIFLQTQKEGNAGGCNYAAT